MTYQNTEDYIKRHIDRVRKHLLTFILLLQVRAQRHDYSKLQEPEINWWKDMDKEPRYAYGTPEYVAKMRRWKFVFDHHYKHNRHHPEHFEFGVQGMNLVDVIEMLCDWIGYRDKISITEAISTVEQQMERYGFSEDLSCIIKNTLIDYFSIMGGFRKGEINIPEGIAEELGYHKEKIKEIKDFHHIDILA